MRVMPTIYSLPPSNYVSRKQKGVVKSNSIENINNPSQLNSVIRPSVFFF